MIDHADGLFPLPRAFPDDAVPACWSYGLGVESTAAIVRTLLVRMGLSRVECPEGTGRL